MVFLVYGVRIGIRANHPELLRRCLDYLPIGWKPSSSPVVERLYSILGPVSPVENGKYGFQLFKDAQRHYRCADKDELLERFEADVALDVADLARRRVFVHAGVVGWGGRAILIPGHSFSGKTTLVAELVRAGAIYYSDEFAVFDHKGLVHPYAQPLQIRENGDRRQRKYPVEKLGGVAGHIPLSVGLVLLTRYKAGSIWRPRHISAGQGLLGVLDNTVSARRAPRVALRTLKAGVAHSFTVRGVRGEATQVVHWLLTYFHPEQGFFRSNE